MGESNEKVVVLGLGYLGLPVALAFARCHSGTVGFDIDASRVTELTRAYDRTHEVDANVLDATTLKFPSDPSCLAEATRAEKCGAASTLATASAFGGGRGRKRSAVLARLPDMKAAKSLLLIAMLHVASLPVIAQPSTGESSVRPGINDKYLSPTLDVETWIGRFEGESRQIFRARDEIIAALNLREGLRVGDIGAGTGLFMRPIAGAVGGTGEVFAVEISPRFIEHLEAIKEVEHLSQVEVVEGDTRSAKLAENSIDLAFICDVYHHFEFPNAMLASLRLALRPGGDLVVVDFKRIPGKTEEWIIEHVRAGQEVFTREILDAGFELVEEVSIDSLDDNYVLRFRSP